MPVLIDLHCTACGGRLPSAPERRIFVCVGCGKSWVPSSRGPELVEIQRQVVMPRQPVPSRGALVLLPVWVLPIHRSDSETKRLPVPDEIRLPAMGIDRLQLLMTFAHRLTRAAGNWQRLEGVHLRHEPAEVTLEDAFEMAELVALRSVEGWPPDDELERVEIPFGPPRLMDIICQREGSELRDLVTGLCAPVALLGEPLFHDQREEITESLSHIIC